MSNIDWSKAPEGTTHYVLSREEAVPSGWYQADGNKMRNIFLDGEYTFRLDDVHPGRLLDLFERHTAWSGEGLPPAGLTVEFSLNRGKVDWATGVVIGQDGPRQVVIKYGSEYHARNIHGVRPIKTAEQIAAQEREKAAEDLYLTINWNSTPSEWANLSRGRREDYFKAIDAGYRKV